MSLYNPLEKRWDEYNPIIFIHISGSFPQSLGIRGPKELFFETINSNFHVKYGRAVVLTKFTVKLLVYEFPMVVCLK